MFNKQIILEQAKMYDSFYLYDETIILENTGKLKKDFKDVEFLYSIKTNHHPRVVETVLSQGFGVDAASLGEVMLGRQLGLSKDKIYYSTPGKSIKDLSEAMEVSVIIADSISEILRIQELAQHKGIIVEIGIRINPDFTFYAQEGKPSKFGIDEKIFYKNAQMLKELTNVKIIGVHVHSRSQELKAEILQKYYENVLSIAKSIQEKLKVSLRFINLGSGLGIPYAPQEEELDTVSLGKESAELINKYKDQFPQTVIYIETGRYVVGKSGVYVTKVLDIKTSYDKTFVILNNTLNGFVRPSLARLVESYSKEENPFASEPLYTCKNAFEIIALTDETKLEVVTLVGNLCTATDVIAEDILLPKLNYDDVVVITNAGSYAAVISPMQFASLVPPVQVFLKHTGEVIASTAE